MARRRQEGTLKVLRHSIRWNLILALVAIVCAGVPAFGQHGGGHAGGGHVSAPHAGSPHVATPGAVPVTHVPPSRPMVSYGPPISGGTRGFVATPPPVRMAERPRTNHPVIGNRVTMPPVLPPAAGPRVVVVGPHATVGFPRTGMVDGKPLHFSPVMSFSGEGHQIWQDSAVDGRAIGNPGFRRAPHTPPFPLQPPGRGLPGRPSRPVFPIFGPPGVGGFGSPFFGLGLGYGFNSQWWPSCGPYWGWGYGCDGLSSYGYGGYGYGMEYGVGGGGGYTPGDAEAQMENQGGPEMYEPPSETSTIFVYGEENRELPQLILKDGTVYNVTDYWLVNDQLHCTTVEGNRQVEHVFDFVQLDLQKTIDVNMARGFRFVLRNEPMGPYLQAHPGSGRQPAGTESPAAPPVPQAPGRPAEPAGGPQP
jgi:hypothetical protein